MNKSTEYKKKAFHLDCCMAKANQTEKAKKVQFERTEILQT